MTNAIVLFLGVAMIGGAMGISLETLSKDAKKVDIAVCKDTTKPNALYLVSVFGYLINPYKKELKDIITAGKEFKQQKVGEKHIAGGCKGVLMELWEEDDFEDEQACGEKESDSTVGHEHLVTPDNGFFHLAGITQDCGPDVEPFIKIIYKGIDGVDGTAPTSCGPADSKDVSRGRIRIAIPDNPYGAINIADKLTAEAKKILTDLKKVDDAAIAEPKDSFYMGRINLMLVEYYHEAHDFEDNELNMMHLAERVEKQCVNEGTKLEGWKVNGKSALFWMKSLLTKVYAGKKETDINAEWPKTAIKETNAESQYGKPTAAPRIPQ